MGRQPNKLAWQYFDYVESSQAARCRICKRSVATPKTCSGNLVRHLRCLHKINVKFVHQRHKKTSGFDEKDLAILKRKFETYLNESQNDKSDNDNNASDKDAFNAAEEHTTAISQNVKTETFGAEEIASVTIGVPSQEAVSVDKYQNGEVNEADEIEEFLNLRDPLNELNQSCPEQTKDFGQIFIKNVNQSPSNEVQTNNPLTTIEVNALVEKHKAEAEKYKAEAEKYKAEAERHRAEAYYFKEIASLTHSKRIFVDLQCEKLRQEILN